MPVLLETSLEKMGELVRLMELDTETAEELAGAEELSNGDGLSALPRLVLLVEELLAAPASDSPASERSGLDTEDDDDEATLEGAYACN